MKRYFYFLLAALLGSNVTATAQLRQYTVLLGGSISGNFSVTSKNANNTITPPQPGATPQQVNLYNWNISVTPRSGVFLLEELAIGAGIDYSYQNRKKKGNKIPEYKSSQLVAGPFVRYYFPNLLFTEVFAGVGLVNIVDRTQAQTKDQERKSDLLHMTAGVGYAYFLNNRVALEPSLKYVYDAVEVANNVREKQHGVELHLGLQIYLYHDKLVLFKQ